MLIRLQISQVLKEQLLYFDKPELFYRTEKLKKEMQGTTISGDVPGILEHEMELCEQPESVEMFSEDLLILTDLPEICAQAKKQGICAVGLEQDEGRQLSDAYAVLTPPFNLDLKWLEMQLCHYHGRPFVLFEDSSFRIRESTWEDYPYILEMLHQDSPSPELSGLFEELDTEGFLAYTERSYRMWGYGMWTVEKTMEPDVGRIEESSTERTSGSAVREPAGSAVREPAGSAVRETAGSAVRETAGSAVRKTEGSAQELLILGWCGLYTSSLSDGGTEMGYVIHPGMRRQGYGVRICREILDFSQEHLGITEVYLQVNPDNHASIALARKTGFSICNEQNSDRNTVLMCYNGNGI